MHTQQTASQTAYQRPHYRPHYRPLVLLLALAAAIGLAWGSWVQPAAAQADEFSVLDQYEPKGWMLNGVQLDRFALVPTTGTDCLAAATCYRIVWREPHADEWLGLFWIHPQAVGSDGGQWSQPGQPGCNLTGASDITVWARGAAGGEVVRWWAAFNSGAYLQTDPVTLTNTWSQYVIDLAGVDLTNVVGAFGYRIDANDNTADVTFYIDQVTYRGVNAAAQACLQATPTATATPPLTATPTATTVPDLTPTATATQVPTVAPTAAPTVAPTVAPTPVPAEPAPVVVLIYAALDNNLSTNEGGLSWEHIVNSLEAGMRGDVRVHLYIDALGRNNAYVYDVMADSNPFCPNLGNVRCDGRYQEGINWWPQPSDDSAQASNIYNFFKQGMQAAPRGAKVIAVLIGHGNGWYANGLPSLPSRWADQLERDGGFLWDDSVDSEVGSRSVATKVIGAVLRQVAADTERPFGLLYLDACSMGMVEVAYELRDSAKYLLASPNTDWASFPYSRLLAQVSADKSEREIGTSWLKEEASVLRTQADYPFTLALVDLSQIGSVLTTTSTLAESLVQVLPTQRVLVESAAGQTTRYESNYDGKLNTDDSYADLNSVSQELIDIFGPASAVGIAAAAVKDAIAAAVVSRDVQGGSPWKYPKETWQWADYGGLSIYLPLPQDDEVKRSFYDAGSLAWAADGRWDEFLATFWLGRPTIVKAAPELPTCISTRDCALLLARPLVPLDDLLYLPNIRR